jgi:transcription elongation factor GreA
MSIKRHTTLEKITFITPKGLERLEGELNHLRTVRRKEIAKTLQDVTGDIEDTEFLIAIEEQAFVEGRILQLESLLVNVRVIGPGQCNKGLIDIGNTVVIRENTMDAETYMIVAPRKHIQKKASFRMSHLWEQPY